MFRVDTNNHNAFTSNHKVVTSKARQHSPSCTHFTWLRLEFIFFSSYTEKMRQQRSHHTVASHAALHGDMLKRGLRVTRCILPHRTQVLSQVPLGTSYTILTF